MSGFVDFESRARHCGHGYDASITGQNDGMEHKQDIKFHWTECLFFCLLIHHDNNFNSKTQTGCPRNIEVWPYSSSTSSNTSTSSMKLEVWNPGICFLGCATGSVWCWDKRSTLNLNHLQLHDECVSTNVFQQPEPELADTTSSTSLHSSPPAMCWSATAAVEHIWMNCIIAVLLVLTMHRDAGSQGSSSSCVGNPSCGFIGVSRSATCQCTQQLSNNLSLNCVVLVVCNWNLNTLETWNHWHGRVSYY